jgi:hypothetical protein
MAQAYTGTATTFNGIPTLLLSSLGAVQDPAAQTALYQVQQWANSVGSVSGDTGTNTAAFGTANFPGNNPSAPQTWTTVSLNGVRAFIPVWT